MSKSSTNSAPSTPAATPAATTGLSGTAPGVNDPYAIANAQQQLNNNSAQFNAALNNVSTNGPYGSVNYAITGYDPTTGAPIYSQNTTLNQAGQTSLNNQQGNQAYATGLAGTALANNANMLTGNPLQGVNGLQTGVNTQGINQNAMNAAYQSAMGLIAPQQQQQTEQNNASMAAQGITDPNSQAYKTSQDNLARQQAYQNNNLAQQSVLTGIQAGNTAFGQNLSNAQLNNSAAAQQLGMNQSGMNQALTNYNGLNSGAIGMPNAINPTASATAPSNVAGAIQNANANQISQQNAQLAQQNNTNTGLFSLGAAALMAPSGTFSGLSSLIP